MTNWQDDDPIDALRAELKREPLSPEFAARLRQRIEADAHARPASWLSTWRWVIPVGAVAGMIVWLVLPSSKQPTTPMTAVNPQTPAPVQTVTQAPAPAVASAPVAAPVKGSLRPVIRTAAAADPAPEVITNQASALRALWASARTAKPRIEVKATVAPAVIPEITTPAIEVAPLVVKELGEPAPIQGVFRIVR